MLAPCTAIALFFFVQFRHVNWFMSPLTPGSFCSSYTSRPIPHPSYPPCRHDKAESSVVCLTGGIEEKDVPRMLHSQVIKGRPRGLFNGDASRAKEEGQRGESRLRGQSAPLNAWLCLVHSGSKQREGDRGCCAQSDFTVHSVRPDWSRCYSGMVSYSGE